MDVMDYFSDRAVTFSSDGATELDASFPEYSSISLSIRVVAMLTRY